LFGAVEIGEDFIVAAQMKKSMEVFRPECPEF
jgi:hypothetical protein